MSQVQRCDILYYHIVKKCDISKGLDIVISHNVKIWYYKGRCDFSSMIAFVLHLQQRYLLTIISHVTNAKIWMNKGRAFFGFFFKSDIKRIQVKVKLGKWNLLIYIAVLYTIGGLEI